MIVCPNCKKELNLKKGNCEIGCECGYQFIVKENVIYFSIDKEKLNNDYPMDGFNRIEKMGENHFWFKTRNELIIRTLNKFSSKSDRILEVGSGTGLVSGELIKKGYNVTLSDLFIEAISFLKSKDFKNVVQFDIYNSPFKNEFDLVCLFDVLEHLENEKMVLENIKTILKNEGKVILTVPAHMILWSVVDEYSGHKRRYNRNKLIQLFKINGFDIIECSYFFTFITPLLYLRKLLVKEKKKMKLILRIMGKKFQ